MRNRLARRTVPIALSLFVVQICCPVRACSVPVFRYALEFWAADAYELTVFHRGPLGGEGRKAVRLLRGDADQHCANVTLTLVDLRAELDGPLAVLWGQQRHATTPWLVVRFPRGAGIAAAAWSGPLTLEAPAAVLNSPAREEIATRLLGGVAAVWVLLESGHATKDSEAANVLQTSIAELARTLRLPAPMAADPLGIDETATNLRVAFSVVRVARDDPKESLLVHSLLRTETDLLGFGEPIAFPVYGRGRVLYALVGKGISKRNIEEACAFLAGWCSCRVKAQNPGVDLLMNVDWDGLVTPIVREAHELPPLSGLSNFQAKPSPSSEAGEAVVPREETAPEVGGEKGLLARNMIIIAVLLIATAAFSTAILKLRRNRR